MESCQTLTEIADKARELNDYTNIYSEKNGLYNNSHPNATQKVGGADDPGNVKGKETGGGFLDTSNGGGTIDINGSPSLFGSGRNLLYAENLYTPDKKYVCF